jgi:uncharacterized protein YvpB
VTRGRIGLVVAALAVAGCASPRADDALSRRLAGNPQARNLTCESRAGCDLLAAHGISVSEDAFFRSLPRSDNPDLGFVGDPDGPGGRVPPEGYGVHAPPVAAALRAFGLDALDTTGRDLAWLAAEAAAGRPVLVWITGGCEPSRTVRLFDARGRAFRAVPDEHVVLVLAVDGSRVRALDPAVGRTREFDAREFDAAWALFDRAAVSASGPRGPR